MANVLVVLDEDPTRRAAYTAKVRTNIVPMPWLRVSACEGAGWSAVWAVSPTAPVSVDADGVGGAMVWGDAVDESGRRQSAAEVRAAWCDDAPTMWDGFHLAIAADGAGRLTAGVDVLGAFPLYYWAASGVVLVGTSVDLFSHHPAFSAQIDPVGLSGVLLTNGLVGGATLWSGVRRLGVRRQLRVRDGRLSEVETYRVPENYCDTRALPIAGHAELLGDAIQMAMRRQLRSGEPHGLLLSGGLDSRQLGGFLVEQGTPVRALTFGLSADVEMKCARQVAAALKVPHDTAEVPYAAYPAAAQSIARWEAMAAGFSNVVDWGMVPHLARLPSRVVLGHTFDTVIGANHLLWAYDPVDNRLSFDRFFERLTAWAFTPTELRKLLQPAAHDAVDVAVRSLRDTYESSSEQPHLQAWHGDLLTRQRFHVGATFWPISFRSWPVSPVFDRNLLAVAASIPASSMADRRVQKELLVNRFPHLAALPIDKNRYDTLSLKPRLVDHFRVRLAARWRSMIASAGLEKTLRERRYYYRTFDFDNPGWRAVRELAEPFRDGLPSVVRRAVVDEWLPKPDRTLGASDGIIDSAKAKLVVGLALTGHHFRCRE